jgi:hypothetical protein
VVTTIQTAVAGNIGCVAYDIGNGTIWFRTNGGNWNNSGTSNPATNTGGISLLFGSSVYPAAALYDATDQITVNFGATAYAFTPPTGFGNW